LLLAIRDFNGFLLPAHESVAIIEHFLAKSPEVMANLWDLHVDTAIDSEMRKIVKSKNEVENATEMPDIILTKQLEENPKKLSENSSTDICPNTQENLHDLRDDEAKECLDSLLERCFQKGIIQRTMLKASDRTWTPLEVEFEYVFSFRK
jgi:hypothetical protein